VTWTDITGYPGWKHGPDAKEFDVMVNKTRGYLLSKDKKFVRVYASYCTQDPSTLGDVLVFPRANIIKIVKTGKKKKK
jgi:hypothetical protein